MDERSQVSALAARVAYLERQNRMLKRAILVLFLLVGVGLIATHMALERHLLKCPFTTDAPKDRQGRFEAPVRASPRRGEPCPRHPCARIAGVEAIRA